MSTRRRLERKARKELEKFRREFRRIGEKALIAAKKLGWIEKWP